MKLKPFITFTLFSLEAILLARWSNAIFSHMPIVTLLALGFWTITGYFLFTKDPTTLRPRGLTWFSSTCMFNAFILSVAGIVSLTA